MDALRLDGNAAAGLLHEVFGTEVTIARGTCDGCGAVEAVGAVHLYSRQARCFAARTATPC